MTHQDLEILETNGRKIVVKGLGKLFYQNGFPISMSISECNKKGWEPSIYHIADECLKNGWSGKTTLAKLKGEVDLDIDGAMANIDWQSIEKFIFSSYEEQRDIIFNYLWKDLETAKEWGKKIIQYDTTRI
jgi:hypothetical protein